MSGGNRHGFSLVEVVVATGILALAATAIAAWSLSAGRTAGDTRDERGVAALGAQLRVELDRLRDELGLDGLAAAVPPAGSATSLRFVGTRDGACVLCADAPSAAADRSLIDPEMRGIARRDRYFLIEVNGAVDFPYSPEAGFLAISATVSWPYLLPCGPATQAAAAPDEDPAREVPRGERSWTVLVAAITP